MRIIALCSSFKNSSYDSGTSSFLGNTFSTDPKSAHFQNPPLIPTILACHYWDQPTLKKLLQAQNLPSPGFSPFRICYPESDPSTNSTRKFVPKLETLTRNPSFIGWGVGTRRLLRACRHFHHLSFPCLFAPLPLSESRAEFGCDDLKRRILEGCILRRRNPGRNSPES